MRKTVSVIILFLLLASSLNLAFNIKPVRAEPGTIIVPDDYPTIQQAVNAANPGDTIIVKAGTYIENVEVNKDHLTIESESGAEVTTVQANWEETAFTVGADYVNIIGFTVKGMGGWWQRGIFLWGAKQCTIFENIVSDNTLGIYLYYSSNNNVSSNILNLNGWNGIGLSHSFDNTLSNNTVSNGSSHGFSITDASFNNLVAYNTISNNSGPGIGLYYSSSNNTIHNNIVSNNWYGVDMDSFNNTIYFNNFIDNSYSPYPWTPNTWNSPEKISYTYNGKAYTNYLGNYWSDYTGSDANGDGIGDTFYSTDGDKDNYPLMKPFKNYLAPIPPPPTVWVEVYGTGSSLAIRQTHGLEGEVLERGPDGWVLKVKDTHEDSVVKDGYTWWEVEDATCGISGWSASEYLRTDDQERLENNTARIDDVNQRKAIILEAVAHYYNNEDTFSSLYSSDDSGNNLSKLKKNNFPIELILAIGIVESGDFYFDNEVYGMDKEGDYENGGVGIMQVTGSSKGWGSKLICYAEQCRVADGTIKYEYPGGWRYKDKYYGNSKQGIYANIKDGLRVLQWAYEAAEKINADNPIAGAVWRYNLGRKWKVAAGQEYLNAVGDKLLSLSKAEYFGADYRSILEGYSYQPLREDQIKQWAKTLRNYVTATIHSSAELRVYDLQQVTGLVNGAVKIEIPNSDYCENSVVIFSPSDSYQYVVVGITEGQYNLMIGNITEQEFTVFNATDIPTSTNASHQYTIDWPTLRRVEEGVTVQVDSDGDGAFEQTVRADNQLSHDEFMLQTATTIDFDPDTLNLKSGGKWVTVYVELPQGFDANSINVSSIRINSTVPAVAKPTEVRDYDRDGKVELMVKFDRSAVMALFKGKTIPGKYVIELTGTVASIRFKGTDTIRVMS